mgnify:CR=1 FL=1
MDNHTFRKNDTRTPLAEPQGTPENIAELTWLPDSCAYRRLHVGKGLPSWHPLLTGNKEAMHAAGISVQGKTVNEMKVKYLEDCIALWPMLDVE